LTIQIDHRFATYKKCFLIAIIYIGLQYILFKTTYLILNYITTTLQCSLENRNIKIKTIQNFQSNAQGTPISSDSNTSSFIDISEALGPGVYAIRDETSNKSYFGESQELAIRLGRHKQALDEGIHHNHALQDAWDEIDDPTKFKFIILEWGPAWYDSDARKAKEAALIEANADKCFNSLPNSPQPRDIIKPIIIDGVRYESTRDAERKLGRARAVIRRDLLNKAKPNIYYLEPEPYGSIPVFAQIGKDGKEGPILLFHSMKSVADAGFATDTQMVRRRILSPNYPGWRYALLDNENKPVRRPYTPLPGETTYNQWLKENNSSQEPLVQDNNIE